MYSGPTDRHRCPLRLKTHHRPHQHPLWVRSSGSFPMDRRSCWLQDGVAGKSSRRWRSPYLRRRSSCWRDTRGHVPRRRSRDSGRPAPDRQTERRTCHRPPRDRADLEPPQSSRSKSRHPLLHRSCRSADSWGRTHSDHTDLAAGPTCERDNRLAGSYTDPRSTDLDRAWSSHRCSR